MATFKRIFFFFLVNILIIVTISIILSLLGIQGYLTSTGIDYGSLMVFCLIWGMVGAFMSLALSRVMAKWMLGVKVINPSTNDSREREILNMVYAMARSANLPKMPEVGIYNSPEVNAFATGPTKSRALVAVSAGLLSRLDRREVEGVIGHEIAHVANGDMVTMTLIQGIINAFVMFLARVLAFFVSQFFRGNDDREGPSPFMNMILVFLFEIVFSMLGLIVVSFFSRTREFKADRGGAQIAGRDKMIGALEALQRTTQLINNEHASLATLKISGKKTGGIVSLFASHPPLEERIQRLKEFK